MKKLFAVAFLGFFLLPVAASAASALAPYWGPFVSCVGSAPTGTTPGGSDKKVCDSFCDLLSTGQNFIKFGITIGLYVLAPIFLVWGGIMIMTAGGNESKVTEARKMLLSTVLGIAVTLGAFLIVNTFFFFFAKVIPTSSEGGAPTITWDKINCSVIPTPAGPQCGGATYGFCPDGQSCTGPSGSYTCATVD